MNRRKLFATGIITGLVICLFSEKSWASEEEGDDYCKTEKNDEGNQNEEDNQGDEESEDDEDSGDDNSENNNSEDDDNTEKEKKTCPVIKKIKPKEWKADKCLTGEHIKKQFGEKFPLKMVTFEAPDAGDPDCMVIEIGSRKIPACSVNTVLKVLKWPLYLRYIIWSVMEL